MIPLLLALAACTSGTEAELRTDAVTVNPEDNKKCGTDQVWVPERYLDGESYSGGCVDVYKAYQKPFIEWMQTKSVEYRKNFEDYMRNVASRFVGDKKPVIGATWQESSDFCAAQGKELISERLHYNASRGTSGKDIFAVPGGQELTAENATTSYVTYADSTSDVDNENHKNSFGVYGLTGNAWERVSNSKTILLGGSWFNSHQVILRVGYRYDNLGPDYRGNDVGLRCSSPSPSTPSCESKVSDQSFGSGESKVRLKESRS